MRLLLLGKNGQLGWELHRTLATLGPVTALDYPDFDITQPDQVRTAVLDANPDIILNATAYTAVDKAESEPEMAQAVNGAAPGILAKLAKHAGAALIHYSTDYVFNGHKGSPYTETDQPAPLNVYGHSKLAGEQAITQVDPAYLILRTSWVYSLRRDSFVSKVLSWASTQPSLKIVTDQVGNPTWARLLAEATAQLLAIAYASGNCAAWIKERRGIYHLAGAGYASRYEWAKAILQFAIPSTAPAIQPALTEQFPTPAQRPLFSALNCDHFTQTFGISLPPWCDALELAISGTNG